MARVENAKLEAPGGAFEFPLCRFAVLRQSVLFLSSTLFFSSFSSLRIPSSTHLNHRSTRSRPPQFDLHIHSRTSSRNLPPKPLTHDYWQQNRLSFEIRRLSAPYIAPRSSPCMKARLRSIVFWHQFSLLMTIIHVVPSTHLPLTYKASRCPRP